MEKRSKVSSDAILSGSTPANDGGLKEGIEQGRANAIKNMFESGMSEGEIAEIMQSTVTAVKSILIQ